MKPPETTRALLPSAGHPHPPGPPVWTWHEFHGYEEVPAEDLTSSGPAGLRPGRALLFRCTDTGAVRRWGLE